MIEGEDFMATFSTDSKIVVLDGKKGWMLLSGGH